MEELARLNATDVFENLLTIWSLPGAWDLNDVSLSHLTPTTHLADEQVSK